MARKLLIGLAVLLVLAVAALLVAPSFIDWGQYKGRIAQASEDALGRRLEIGGALSLSILPLPTLVAEDVRFANDPRGSVPDMATVKEVRIRISLAALLRGDVQVDSVRLVSPVVTLERLPDGGANWLIEETRRSAEGGAVARGPVAGRAESEEASPLGLSLDAVEIVDGRVSYRDAARGIAEDASAIAAQLSARTLSGPYQGQGTLRVRGMPLSVKGTLGALGGLAGGGSAPLGLDVDVLDGAASLSFSGRLDAQDGTRVLRGDLRVKGDRLPVLLEAAGLSEPPPALARPFAADATVAATPSTTTFENVSLRLGDGEARGGVSADYGGAVPSLRVDLSVSAIDVGKWLAGGEAAPSSELPLEPAAALVPAAPDPEAGGTATVSPPRGGVEGGFSLPSDIAVALDLRADAVAWRGGVVRQAHLAADLRDGEVTLHELTGQMPGNSSLGVFGFLSNGEGGQPALDLTVQARSDNLRAALDWLGIDVSAVPGGRLTQLDARARVGGSLRDIRLRSVDATIDTTTLRGAATILPGPRPAMGLTLKVGSLNLDAYMPPTVSERPEGERSAAGLAGGDEASSGGAGGAGVISEPALLAGLGAVNDMDANFRLDADTVTWRGVPLHEVHAEGALVGGKLTLKDTGVGRVLGASAHVSGAIKGFGGVPRVEGLSYGVTVPDPAFLARGFAVDLPVAANALGPMEAEGTLTGTPGEMTLDTTTQVAGGRIDAKGALNGLFSGGASALALDLAVTAHYPDPGALLSLAAPGYRPRGPLGALDLTAQVSGQAGLLALSGLRVTLGEDQLAGDTTVDYTQPRPVVQADLTAGRLTIDRFLPLDQQAWLDVPGLDPAGLEPGTQLAAASGRWSTEPLDLAPLHAVDVTASLRADRLSQGPYDLGDADLRVTLKAGKLDVSSVKGRLFGGALDATAGLDASGGEPVVTVAGTLEGAQLGQVLRALKSGQGASGVGSLTLQATARGVSEAALVGTLAGTGTLRIDNLDVEADASGHGGAQALLGPVIALNRLSGLGRAGAGAKGRAGTLRGSFTIEDGLVRFGDLTLDSNLYGGVFQGIVDLPRWTLDTQGEARLSKTLLTGLLGRTLKLPDVVPVSVSGSLDAPRVTLRTGRAAPTEPAAPSGSDASGEAPPPAPAPGPAKESVPALLDRLLEEQGRDGKAVKPEKLMRDLLKGLQGQ